MKPVPNKRTTPYDVGDMIVHRYWHRSSGDCPHYKIVELVQCQQEFRPCTSCDSGNIAYRAKRFNKRLGIKDFVLCPSRGQREEYVRWVPRSEVVI